MKRDLMYKFKLKLFLTLLIIFGLSSNIFSKNIILQCVQIFEEKTEISFLMMCNLVAETNINRNKQVISTFWNSSNVSVSIGLPFIYVLFSQISPLLIIDLDHYSPTPSQVTLPVTQPISSGRLECVLLQLCRYLLL